ncbi:hypothetical protein [Hydrogenophaga sp.]|uniref:hypothetical protein n=1 Tax=Hydrogenophaga sp. TaxID=1904254 RepID=UPI0035B3FB17
MSKPMPQEQEQSEQHFKSVWDSTPHWTYAREDIEASGGGVRDDFDPRRVRDTLKGRLQGLASRIRRHLPWR